VVEEAKAIIADFPTPHSEDVMHGHEDAYRALEVFHPDAAAALSARDKRIRGAALEAAAVVECKQTAEDGSSYELGYLRGIEAMRNAIRALKEAQP